MATSFLTRYPAGSTISGTISVNVNEFGGNLDLSDSVNYDYSGGAVDITNWTQLIASTAAAAQGLFVFDSSGRILELGVGAAASESRVLIIQPGGQSGYVPLGIAAGSRLAVRALDSAASTGNLIISLLG